MDEPGLDKLLARVRALTADYKKGGAASFQAFRELVYLLFSVTVLDDSGGIRLHKGPRPAAFALGGWSDPLDPLPLNDGRYLRLTVSLYREHSEKAGRVVLKVLNASAQYQDDRVGDDWVVRYDYLRLGNQQDAHPQAHVQIGGTLMQGGCSPQRQAAESVNVVYENTASSIPLTA